MDVIKLEAKKREAGKKNTRRLRREGDVPCVLYGHGIETVAFAVPAPALHPLIYTTETHRVEIEIDGSSWDCIMKDIAYDPVSEHAVHADFLVLQAGETLVLTVPIRTVGKARGQAEGGELVRILTEIDVECLPRDIPSYLEVDISDLDIGDSIHIDQIAVEGVTLLAEPSQTVVTLVAPRSEEELEALETVVAEEEVLEPELAEEGEELEGEDEEEGAEDEVEKQG